MTVKGNNLSNKTNLSGSYDAGQTTKIWAEDHNDIADTVNEFFNMIGSGTLPATNKHGLMGNGDYYVSRVLAEGDISDLSHYTHPTSSGNVHVPSAGATDQVLKYLSAGTAQWVAKTTKEEYYLDWFAGAFGWIKNSAGTTKYQPENDGQQEYISEYYGCSSTGIGTAARQIPLTFLKAGDIITNVRIYTYKNGSGGRRYSTLYRQQWSTGWSPAVLGSDNATGGTGWAQSGFFVTHTVATNYDYYVEIRVSDVGSSVPGPYRVRGIRVEIERGFVA